MDVTINASFKRTVSLFSLVVVNVKYGLQDRE